MKDIILVVGIIVINIAFVILSPVTSLPTGWMAVTSLLFGAGTGYVLNKLVCKFLK